MEEQWFKLDNVLKKPPIIERTLLLEFFSDIILQSERVVALSQEQVYSAGPLERHTLY